VEIVHNEDQALDGQQRALLKKQASGGIEHVVPQFSKYHEASFTG